MISKEKKTAIINEYGRKPGDTGSPEVQIAILTARIQELRPSFQKRSAENGWTEKRSAGVLKEDRPGRLPYINCKIRYQKIIIPRDGFLPSHFFVKGKKGRRLQRPRPLKNSQMTECFSVVSEGCCLERKRTYV